MPDPKRRPQKLSTRDRRDLEVQSAFLEGLVRRDAGFTEALQQLADTYTSLGRTEESLSIDESLSRLRPEDASVHFHLACSYSVTGRVDDAADALQRALDLGFRDFRTLADEPDLQNLRRHPSFARIRARLRQLKRDAGPGACPSA